MKKELLLLVTCFLIANAVFTQNFSLLAEKNSRSILYKTGKAAKLVYTDGEVSKTFRGRLSNVYQQNIVMQSFNQKDSIIVPLSSIVSMKRIARTGRAITGTVAGIGIVSGVSMIIEDESSHEDWFDGLGSGLGVTMMILTAIPYAIVTLSEPQAKTSKGFVFKTIPDSR